MDAIYTDTGQKCKNTASLEHFCLVGQKVSRCAWCLFLPLQMQEKVLSFILNDQWWKDVSKTNGQQGTSREFIVASLIKRRINKEIDCFSGFVYLNIKIQ